MGFVRQVSRWLQHFETVVSTVRAAETMSTLIAAYARKGCRPAREPCASRSRSARDQSTRCSAVRSSRRVVDGRLACVGGCGRVAVSLASVHCGTWLLGQ